MKKPPRGRPPVDPKLRTKSQTFSLPQWLLDELDARSKDGKSMSAHALKLMTTREKVSEPKKK